MAPDAALASPSAKGRGTRGEEAPLVGRRGEAGRLPNFLVIGAARSGTTTLHYALGRHPEIFVSPRKETNFFLFDESGELPAWVNADTRRAMPRTLEQYAALFEDATEQHAAVGESSPGYLHGPVARRIKADLPDARLIAILRQPVEQALSIYATWQGGDTRAGGLIEPFLAALADDAPGPDGDLPLARHGLYQHHLAPFFDQFERSQIKVTLLDDMERDGTAYFRELFRFLGVDDSFRIDSVERFNGTGVARNATIHRLLSGGAVIKGLARAVLPDVATRRLARLQHGLRAANLQRSAALSPELRRELTERYYRDDILALEELIGRDLSCWRT
ncbi:MAG: sulfotransferase [Geminicoccaceae bacterium]|jgi:hypothetical protein|nr:sulfotransferase [Geminicoccaceae bacterium]